MRGSVIQKPKKTGRWYVVLDLGADASGRRQQRWHSGYRTKREAERGLTALLSAQDSGLCGASTSTRRLMTPPKLLRCMCP